MYYYTIKASNSDMVIMEDIYQGKVYKDSSGEFAAEIGAAVYTGWKTRAGAIAHLIGQGHTEVSQLQYDAYQSINRAGIETPVMEYSFHPARKWRFDIAWPEYKFAVEIDGGIWVDGRHNRGKGFQDDKEKHNAAVLSGWKVLYFTAGMMEDLTQTIKTLFEQRG